MEYKKLYPRKTQQRRFILQLSLEFGKNLFEILAITGVNFEYIVNNFFCSEREPNREDIKRNRYALHRNFLFGFENFDRPKRRRVCNKIFFKKSSHTFFSILCINV